MTPNGGGMLTWRAGLKPLLLIIMVGAVCFTFYEWSFIRDISTGTARRIFAADDSTPTTLEISAPYKRLPKRIKKMKQSIKRASELVKLKTDPDLAREDLEARKRLLCGSGWRENYIKLHRDILDGTRPQRYLVYQCGGVGYGCGGYGNRISAISSLLFLAILTNRAFLIQWHSNVSIETYFMPSNIQWNLGADKLRGLKTRHHFWGRGTHSNVAESTLRFPGLLAKDFRQWIKQVDFNSYFDHPVEVVTSQWFFADAIRANQHFRKTSLCKQLGTKTRGHRYSLIGCAFDFLFSKTAYLKKLLEQAKKSLVLKPSALTIGIHFRTGDYILYGRKLRPKSLTVAARFFKCAKKLENQFIRSTPGLKSSDISWYLATDSKEIKAYASKRFPKINYLKIKLEHISLNEPSTQGMEGVILDNLLLSESDAMVLSNSSFSQSALGIGFHSLKVSTYGLACQY